MAEDIVLNVDDNLPEALSRLEEFDDIMGDVNSLIEEVGEGFDELTPDEIVDQLEETQDLAFGIKDATELLQDNFDVSHENIEDMVDSLGQTSTELEDVLELQEEMTQAKVGGDEERASALGDKIQQEFSEFQQAYEQSLSELQAEGTEISEKFGEMGVDVGSNIREGLAPENLGQTIGDTFSKASEGDLAGIMGGAATGPAGEGLLEKGGAALEEKGSAMEAAGQMKGSTKKSGMGKLAKHAGKMAKFAGAAGALTAVVALLKKAYGQAKDLNKEMLKNASYAELSAATLGDASQAMAQLRESATEMSTNIRLGLDPKQHMEIINTLHQEGAQIRELSDEYNSFGSMATDSVETISVAALNLASSEQEVAKYAGKMMDKHGQSFSQIKEDLGTIQEMGVEADMSTKKFFGTVQQMGDQLDLYNYSLGDSVEMLSQMSKVMSADKAKEFTKQMTSGLKEMSHQERMRTIALNDQAEVRQMVRDAAGDNLRKLKENTKEFAVAKDIMTGLTEKSVEGIDDMKKRLEEMESGTRQKFLARIEGQVGEKAFEQLSQSANMMNKASGPLTQLNDVVADLGARESMELQVGALENALGKPINEMSSMVTKQFGVDQDRLRALQRIKSVSEGGYKSLQSIMGKTKDGSEKQREEIAKMAKKLDLNIAANEKGQLINTKTEEAIKSEMDIMSAMKDDAKKQVKNETQQLSAAERQVTATQSVGRILETSIADALNMLGDIMLRVEKLLVDWAGIGSDTRREQISVQREMAKDKKEKIKLQERLNKAQKRGADSEVINKLKDQIKQKEKDIDGRKNMKDILETQEGKLEKMNENQKKKRLETLKKASKIEGGGERVQKIRKEAAKAKGEAKKLMGKLKQAGSPEKKKKIRGKLDKLKKEYGLTYQDEKVTGGPGPGAVTRKMKKGLSNLTDEKKDEARNELLSRIKSGKIESVEGLTKTFKRITEQQGIKVDEDNMQSAVGKGVMDALERQKMMEKLMKQGFSKQEAEMAVGPAMQAGSAKEAAKMIEKKAKNTRGSDTFRGGVSEGDRKGLTKVIDGPKPSDDAKMVTGGIPFLDLQKGDVIVDQEELGKARRGSAGTFADEAVGNKKGGSARQLNATFNINGGNVQEIENKILKVLNQWERGGK